VGAAGICRIREGFMIPIYVSQAFLWIVVAGLALVVLALIRQVGVLHERLAPVGALTNAGGPAVGQPAPLLRAVALDGTTLELGTRRASGRSLLLLFVARSCPICKTLIPVARDVARAERLDVLFLGDADLAEQQALIAEFGIAPSDFVNGPEIGMAYRVDKLPHAAFLDPAGMLVAKGLVNSREHLESLVVAQETGFGSIQDFVRARQAAA
jgi:methylamine dehydrogenase accessory protein MauD